MAIIRTGPIVNAISGALGPLVFVAGSGSPVVRPRGIKIKTSSGNTLKARSRMANLRRHWQQLSTDDQNTWRTAASTMSSTNALGVTSPMTGFRLFMKTQLARRHQGGSIDDTPNVAGTDIEPLDVAATFSASGAYTITANSGPAGLGLFYLYGWPFARDWDARATARLRFLQIQFGSSISVNVKTAWVDLFGELQENQRFAIGVAYARATRFLSRIVQALDDTAA